MLAGFDYATGDCCVVMDADLQDPPELVDQMLEYWEEGYDDIYAKRRTRGEESWLRRQFSLAFYGILQRMSRIDILPNVGDFRLLDRRCVLTLRRLRECERYTKGLFCWIGYQKKSIEFDRGDWLMGHSSWNFLKLLNLAVEGITSFSIAPLRIATVCGVLCSISSFIYAIYFLIKTVLYGDETAGFPTLIIVMLFLGGIQLFSLGIIGEYVGRIFKETKGRPTYIASDYNEEKLGYDGYGRQGGETRSTLLSVSFIDSLVLFYQILRTLQCGETVFFHHVECTVLPCYKLQGISLLLIFEFLPVMWRINI